MKTCARLLVTLGLILLHHDFRAFGNHEEVKILDTSTAAAVEPEPTPAPVSSPPTFEDSAIDRSSYHHPHVVHHHNEEPTYQGFWKKKFVWRPRWVKTWQEKKVYVAVWKRMWGPAVVKEWVPVPKPPPGWVKQGHGNYFIKTHH